ncbi:MAG: hypothetical protein A2104_08035 [Candidatus Melainabacteria bacterium GWF2_32_7]|nr:MAG: hypothetical protein A2104_08035 [Candidatus Melainabacteria bacterium GWF2_32_7]
MKKEVNAIKKEINAIKNQVKNNTSQIQNLNENVRLLEIQTKENTQILQALMHSAEVNKAVQDKMAIDTARIQGDVIQIKSDVLAIRKDLSMVETITANNYSDIAKLKAIS